MSYEAWGDNDKVESKNADFIPFQARVWRWMQACFGSTISDDKVERGDRFLEEALELLQASDYPRERVEALTRYVYSRPVGEMFQETGGTMVTLAALCTAHDIEMDLAAEVELTRVWTKVEAIRAKQLAKPLGSALPQAWPSNRSKALIDVMNERDRQWNEEGFNTAHDDTHTKRELAAAGACYAAFAALSEEERAKAGPPENVWIWDLSWWKPTNPRRDLVKAAALILAEIERLDRASALIAAADEIDAKGGV